MASFPSPRTCLALCVGMVLSCGRVGFDNLGPTSSGDDGGTGDALSDDDGAVAAADLVA